MRRLLCLEPQVRPRSQRGASIARRAIEHVAREQRRLGLRLAIAAHGAVADDAAVRESSKGRIERVEWQPPGLECVQGAGREREAHAAILHQHTGLRQHDAGPEFPVERLGV